MINVRLRNRTWEGVQKTDKDKPRLYFSSVAGAVKKINLQKCFTAMYGVSKLRPLELF